MKITRLYKGKQKPWTKIALTLSVGFLFLSLITWVLGRWVIEDNSERVLEQRLVIAQLVANDIDRKFQYAELSLGQIRQRADFDPADTDLTQEADVLLTAFKDKASSWQNLVFLDTDGKVILAYPPTAYLKGSDLSSLAYVEDTLETKQKNISLPFQSHPNDDSLLTAIAFPIMREEQLVGLLFGTVDLNGPAIFESLQDAVNLGKTAHAILVDDQGRTLISTFHLPFLSPGEHQMFYQRALKETEPLVETVPFELEYPGEPRGHLHVMAFVPLKSLNWGLSMGGDVGAETFGGVRRLALIFASLSGLSIAGVWMGTLLSTRQLLDPVDDTVLKFDLINKVVNTGDWDNLVQEIVQLPANVAPVQTAQLFLYDAELDDFDETAEWNPQKRPVILPSVQAFEHCRRCIVEQEGDEISPYICHVQTEHGTKGDTAYCLPLVHQMNMVGLLHFSVPQKDTLSPKQQKVLTSVASDLAIAIESFQLHQHASNQIEITKKERMRIARHLHDNLGQNVSYLRFKLDQFTGDYPLEEISAIKAELERMREVADEAFQQVRSTLETLHTDTVPNLENALAMLGQKYANRGTFELSIQQEGHPFPMTGIVQRQVLDICKEVFSNIEKHAQATQVTIQTIWRETFFKLIITDNGQGFETRHVDETKHFGLGIIRERVQILKGDLRITSSLQGGTEVAILIHKNAPNTPIRFE